MIKLKDLLLERGMLSIFDFDDTLVTSDSWVYVKRPDGTEMQLDAAEFAVYTPKKGETFDFRDFLHCFDSLTLQLPAKSL